MANKSAEKGSEEVNKSAAIRDLLVKHPSKKPMEIAALMLEEYKIEVLPQYVSTIKSNMNAKLAKTGSKGKRSGAPRAVQSPATDLDGLTAAVEFIKTAGGIDAAKAAIEAIEQIRAL
jgi:hypothetical protein